jgi:putative secretion ATPase (PEP-CTERM system associated)
MYERFFGLSAKPFQLNPDPDFFFGSKGHRRAMAYLEYGLHQGEGFIVITGEVGAGKTTLLRGLLRRIPGDTVVPGQIVSTQVDSEDLLRLVAATFGVPIEGADKSTLLVRLQSHFEGLHADGRRALLIVDEAQNLSPRAVEELRMLSNFQDGTRSLVQSFLVGQPEFRGILQRPEMRQLKQRVTASYHLGPLDADETQRYIEHRLGHVGWRQDPAFDADAFAPIHQATDGIPRRINAVCDRLLLSAFLSERHAITAADVAAVVEEMDGEMGGGGSGRVGVRPMAEVHPFPAARPGLPELGPAAKTEASMRDQISRLEERVATLETSNGMMLNLIKRMLRILRASGTAPEAGAGAADADRSTGS